MLFGIAQAAAGHERVEQERVGSLVERSEFEPRLQATKPLVGSRTRARRQLCQERHVGRAVALPLRAEPAGEFGATVDDDALEQVAAEPLGQRREALVGSRSRPSFASRSISSASTTSPLDRARLERCRR